MATQPVGLATADDQLQERAFALLARELGLADYARFLRLFGSGRGDYTADRQTRQTGKTLEEILRDLKTSEAA